MLAVIVGIVLVIVGVALWLGGLTLAHAVAVFIGLVGVLLVCYYLLPANAYARRR